jgi:hypothetical protein
VVDNRAFDMADHERHMAGCEAVGYLMEILESGVCTSEIVRRIVAKWKLADRAMQAALDVPNRESA